MTIVEDKKYHLYNGDKLIGSFTLLSSKDKYLVTLIDGLDDYEVPIDFMMKYIEGRREFRGQEVFEWIQDRVIPSGRQNIDEILRKMNLPEYDELGIFMYFNGKCCRDSYRIEEIK